MKIETLDKLPMMQSATVIEVLNSNIKRRLLNLGVIKGTDITPVLASPSSDPIAYEVKGSLIAIRNSEAKTIKVITD